MNQDRKLFFIALLPPKQVQTVATEIKQHFARVYNSKAALKSPPHVTLQPPFFWEIEQIVTLEEVLAKFARSQSAISITLDGFAAFPPRVIYINVLKTPELLELQTKLITELESSLAIVDKNAKNRPFAPHLTVGFKDLTKANFYRAWEEFQSQKIYFEFTVYHLTLLTHNGQNWEIKAEFLLQR